MEIGIGLISLRGVQRINYPNCVGFNMHFIQPTFPLKIMTAIRQIDRDTNCNASLRLALPCISTLTILYLMSSQPVVDGSKNKPDFHFPLRIKAKISEYASILTFQITLSFQVNFHLTPRQQRKKFQIFINSPQTLNLAINLKFRKKSEIFGFGKFYKNYLIFFVL